MKAVRLLALLCLFATSSHAQIPALRELMPPPKVAYLTASKDTARVYLPLAITLRASGYDPSRPEGVAVDHAAGILGRAFRSQFSTLGVLTGNFTGVVPATDAFIVGVKGSSPAFDSLIEQCLTPGETLDHVQGYLIHARKNFILIAGNDTAGLVQGATRFTELWAGSNKYLPAHILDYPDYPNRWAFSMHNMRGTNAVNVLKNILDTMQRYHYNGMQQNDFKYNILEEQPAFYFRNADTIITYASERQIEMIPGVAPMGYSEGILWHDRNLAEGFPATSRYVIESDTARLIPDPPVGVVNGGFENVNASGAFTGFGFYDNDNSATTADAQIKHSGTQSARVIDPIKANPSGNARFSLPITTKPNKYYYLSVWVRTENVDQGEFRVLAIGTDAKRSLPLTHTAFNVPSTTDRTQSDGWVKLGVLFNTQDFAQMNIYCGVWGGNKGKIWWDDFKIEEAGFVNILRRDGTPLTVTTSKDVAVTEGSDFSPLHDSIMLKQSVLYDWHQAPIFRRVASGKLKNGDTIIANYYHAFTVINDVNGYGEVMACPSDEGVLNVVKNQIGRVKTLHRDPRGYMLGHDEIRHMNWDDACTSRNMSSAEILGDNVTKIATHIHSIAPKANIYAWSDMFDSLHNAVIGYYAVRGDLTGSWNYIPKDITIINWNSGKKALSLDFFAKHGFAQMTSPYYDAQNTINMREWRLAISNVPNVKGMMYTTWVGDYSFLRPMGYYNWGAGPYIIHKPIDSATAATTGSVIAEVFPDPFDGSDRITSVKAIYTLHTSGITDSIALAASTKILFNGTLPKETATYRIVAANQQGLIRETPTYILAASGTASVKTSVLENDLTVYPNPTTASLTVQGGVILRILSLSGAEILIVSPNTTTLDVSMLAAGTYLSEIMTANGTSTVKFVKQ